METHIQEIASLVQQALSETNVDQQSKQKSDLSALSNSEINASIQSTIKNAIKANEKQKVESELENKSNSKLGFLQKVVTLDCFFGGSDCLFKDKKSMMAGRVTEFAKKKFEQGDRNVAQYLAQVKNQVSENLKSVKEEQQKQQQQPAQKVEQKVQEQAKTSKAQNDQKAKENELKAQKAKEAELNKQLHDSVQELLKIDNKKQEQPQQQAVPQQQAKPQAAPQAPPKVNLAKTAAPSGPNRQFEVQVPIDEVKALGLKCQATENTDEIQSVTLKSFRKMVGYDTFNSILKKERDESKDMNDYYNVTVSMMFKRNKMGQMEPVDTAAFKDLSQRLDKGFPYDDSNIQHQAQQLSQMTVKQVVGKLSGENITKENLMQLAKGDEKKLFAEDSTNVTKKSLKNLVTDKPAPITTKLAQTTGVPVLVKPVLMQNDMADHRFNNRIRVGISDVTYAQEGEEMDVQLESENPVVNPPFNNWSVNQPSPPHNHGMIGNEDLEQRHIIIDGVNYDFVQTKEQNPVVNPPFNNWSVNQPSPPHQRGLDGKADLGQNIIVDGHPVHYAQQREQSVKLVQTKSEQKQKNPVVNPPFNNWSVNQPSPPHQHGLDGKADLGQNIIVDGHPVHYAQKMVGDNQKHATNLAQLIPLSDEQNQPGVFNIIDRDTSHSPLDLAQVRSSSSSDEKK